MTGARPLSYGQLLNEALLQLNQAISGPVRFSEAGAAVTAAQARTRIYRTIARAADSCAAALGAAAADRAAGLTEAGFRSAARLHADLSASVAGTRPVLDLPAIEPVPAYGTLPR